jgi:hypothetical protein
MSVLSAIEHVLARRTERLGQAGTASVVMLYLDDTSLRQYTVKSYDENHGAFY